MLLLPLRAPWSRRSNRHLHHRLAEPCASALSWHAGEQAKSASVDVNAGSQPFGRTGARDSTALARPLPRYVTPKAGFEPALPGSEVSEIFTTSVWLSRKLRQTR
jgi:hypothetical protein